MVITQEGPNQEGKTWDVELMSAQAYGEAQMKALAREMGEQGEYVVLVGTLTTTGHNQWADAAIAYQANFPKMKMAADRFPGADFIDESRRVTQDILSFFERYGHHVDGFQRPDWRWQCSQETQSGEENRWLVRRFHRKLKRTSWPV